MKLKSYLEQNTTHGGDSREEGQIRWVTGAKSEVLLLYLGTLPQFKWLSRTGKKYSATGSQNEMQRNPHSRLS
jgi:hypothetical protein